MHRSSVAVTVVAVVVLAMPPLPARCAAPAVDLEAIAGVYKQRFTNGDITGASFPGENILEVVPVGPASAYVKTHLDFFNGHLCGIAGIADLEDAALVYRDRSPHPGLAGPPCSLTLRITASTLVFEDPDGACRAISCGMRGGYAGGAFDRSARRPIRYMKRLKNSADFRHAVEQHVRSGD